MPLVAALALLCVVHAARPDGLIGDSSYVIVTLGAGLIGLGVASRRPMPERRSLLWIAVGVTCSGIGDLLYMIIQRIDGVAPDASIADIFYLASYVAFGIGLLMMLQSTSSVRSLDIDSLIDTGSFAVFAMIVVGVVVGVGDDVFRNQSLSVVARLVWVAYPILDAALLAVLLRSMITRRLFSTRGLLVAAGITFWLSSDFATLLKVNADAYSTWMDLGWMLGAASMIAGIAARSDVDRQKATRAPRASAGARVVISLCPLLAPGIVQIWASANHRPTSPVLLFIATVALVLLAAARSTRLVRARHVHEARLVEGERYFQALAENSADAVVVVDSDGRIVNDSPNLAEMVGKPGQLTIGCDAIDFINPTEPESVRTALARMQASQGVVNQGDLRIRHTDGGERWFSLRIINQTFDPAIAGLIVNIHDITDRKRVEAELVHRAFHDPLTGLANRALFYDRIDHALRRASRTGNELAIVYLDVDGFKTLNDSRGHEAGDNALRDIAARLVDCVRPADTVARFGGDEFAILIESPDPLAEAGSIAERILNAFTTPFQVGEQQVVLSTSIGVTIGDRASSASSLLRDADIAMYRSKTTGRAKWSVYEPQMRAAAVDRFQIELDLQDALADRQFSLLYQPIVELEPGTIIGFETLIRWHHPTRGLVEPDSFISIAEANGSIVEIGRWVLDEACRVAAEWQTRYPNRNLSIAVNVSARQLARHDIVDHVRLALRQSGLTPASLVLELTETALVQDAGIAALRLHELRALGVKLAVDDFGTGYSSLSYLRQFPVDILKIDRSFINTITEREQVPAIVRGLLDLGRTLNLQTVAEGIEVALQRDALRDQQCQFGQGFLFARPMPLAEVTELLASSFPSDATDATDAAAATAVSSRSGGRTGILSVN